MGVGKSDQLERNLVHVALGNELDKWMEENSEMTPVCHLVSCLENILNFLLK